MGFLGGTSGKEIPTNAGDAEELMFLNCGAREDSWESLG